MVKQLLILLLIVGVSGCVSTPDYRDPKQGDVDAEERSVGDGQAQPLPQDPQFKAESLSRGQAMSPVVRQLTESAQQELKVANWEGAANYLERALRIESRNAILWGRLAGVRYRQQDWQQAIQLAAKSNTLSRDNETLRRQNWYLMVNAYNALDNLDQAQKYRDKLSY